VKVAPNIRQDRWSVIVDIRRGGKRHVRHFPKRHSRALADAQAFRDEIIKNNPRRGLKTVALSNTGLVGISETSQWTRSQCFDCFMVTWYKAGRRHHKRIVFGCRRSRAAALRLAIALRAAKIGAKSLRSHVGVALNFKPS